MKWLIQTFLQKFNYRLTYTFPNSVSGYDVEHDLAVVINKANPICLDVGANRGQTIDRLISIFDSPRIFSFEPSSEVYNDLITNGYGKHAALFNIALGSTEEKREFVNYKNSVLSSLLKLDKSAGSVFQDTVEKGREIVEVQTIDKFLAIHNIAVVDLLKIDTQGFDFEVLKGAVDSLCAGRIRCVFVELNFVSLYEGQARYQDILRFLENHNFYLIDLYEKFRKGHSINWCTALFKQQEA